MVDPVDWWITPFADNPFLRDALRASASTPIEQALIQAMSVRYVARFDHKAIHDAFTALKHDEIEQLFETVNERAKPGEMGRGEQVFGNSVALVGAAGD